MNPVSPQKPGFFLRSQRLDVSRNGLPTVMFPVYDIADGIGGIADFPRNIADIACHRRFPEWIPSWSIRRFSPDCMIGW